jgi:hypothetical protein
VDSTFISILQKLVSEQGKEALLNPARCKAFLADYTHGEYKKESRLLLQALEAGVPKAIDATKELEICKQQQIGVLREEHFLAVEVAADVVDALALVLRGDASITQAEPPKPKSPPQIKPQPMPGPMPVVEAPSPAAPSQTTFCSNCGKELQKEWGVCPFCGTQVVKIRQSTPQTKPQPMPSPMPVVEAPSPAAPSQTTFCSNCGKELQKEWGVCPYCKTSVAKTEMQASGQGSPQNTEPSKNIKKLLLAATIVGLVIWLIILLSVVSSGVDIIMIPIFLIMAIAIMLNVRGQRTNNRKMILAAGILYTICLFYGWPSAVLCFIAYAKMKNDKARV